MRRLVSLAATTIVTLGLLLALDSATGSSAAPHASKAVPVITIQNLAYRGALTVNPGVRVKVTNNDGFAHTFSNPNNFFDTGTIPAGRSRLFTAPARLGNYQIRCHIHSTMHAVLHVVAP